ncbi:glycosyltransferase [Streptomyces sp. NRAIS4]
METLACGIPAVVTDVGGIRHYAGDGPAAVLVPPGDAAAAAEAADKLLAEWGTTDHSVRRMAARERAGGCCPLVPALPPA